jgi:CspA family cold shock protein
MPSLGVVREFRSDDGWGVIESVDTPGGCWVHFSAIRGDGYLAFTPGETVRFEAEPADQDGYTFRATAAWRTSVEDAAHAGDAGPGTSAAYGSSLHLHDDDPGSDH